MYGVIQGLGGFMKKFPVTLSLVGLTTAVLQVGLQVCERAVWWYRLEVISYILSGAHVWRLHDNKRQMTSSLYHWIPC